jgi:cobalt/nickel transport system permease protein
MHIPDGFISPKVYVPSYGIAGLLWLYSVKKIKQFLNEDMLPFLSATTAFAFVLMMIVVPLPGGTTAHALGIGVLAVLFDPYTSFLCISLVLLIQALFFGNGGITTLPVNAIAIGFLGTFTIYYIVKIFKRYEKVAMFVGSFIAVMLSAFVLALILGIQPLIASDATGKPLFFPFGLKITIPAMMIPHIFVGIAEGILTIIAVSTIRKFDKGKLLERKN